jgi:hypothetical protein
MPGLDVRLALGRVRDEVLRTTIRRQEPFVYGSLGGAELPLLPNRLTVPQATSGEAERAWDHIKDTIDISTLEAFVSRFADTFYGELARQKLAALKRRAEEQRLSMEAVEKQKAEEQRLATEVEAKRKAEQLRLATEAQTKRKAEEQRLATEAEAKRKAEQLRLATEAETKRKSEEQRLATEAESKLKAEERPKQDSSAQKATRQQAKSKGTATSGLRVCQTYSRWKLGDECVTKDGRTCEVYRFEMGQSELKCSDGSWIRRN